ncbi:MAG: FMN-binding protein [Bacteroidales bacterium]|nr:FMN-binding protein [Bacteroidales bacterium]
MKKVIWLFVVALLGAGTTFAQHNGQHCGNCPHHQQHRQQQAKAPAVTNPTFEQAVAKAFPSMKSTRKEGKFTAVCDADGKVLGYAVASKPASDGIKGYAGETPVMIAFNAKKKITGVYLLANQETPRFLQHVQESGFYDQWNGLTVKKALKKKVDTVSGATFTSRAVVQSVQALLATL